MRRTTLFTTGLLLLGGATAEAQTGLTIYSDGRVLVRRTIPAEVPQGASTHRLALGPLDPGSLFALDPDVTITGSTYDATVDEASVIRRAVGRTLVFETGVRTGGIADTVVALVLGINPERFKLANGQVLFGRPGRPRYPAELVQMAPTTTVAVRSAARRSDLALGFFTSGASWQATYQVVLGKERARVSGQAVMALQDFDAEDATVQLLAGDVGRAKAVGGLMAMRAQEMDAAAAPASAAMEESIGEVHLYSMPGRLTLRSGIATSAMLFEPADAAWERLYTLEGQLPWYGPLRQYGEEMRNPVAVEYVLKRPRPGDFGDRPLPRGTWRLYQRDSGGALQLVGESSGGHTAAGQDVHLSAGTAFDLTAVRVQTDYNTRRDSLRTIATAGYKVTIANAKDSTVTVDVIENRGGEWRILDSSVPAEKLSSTRTRFRVKVPAQGEAVLTYRVRVTW